MARKNRDTTLGPAPLKPAAHKLVAHKPAAHKPAAKPAAPDEDLWHRVAATIKPLKSRPRPAIKAPLAAADSTAPSAKPKASPPPPPRAVKPALPNLTTSVTAGIDKRTSQRLGRGQLAIEGRLDLHGMTQGEAHDRLAGFIRRAVAAGKRNVLVITGKGFKASQNKMGGETGVLRQAVPRWLNEPGLRSHVVALRHAQPKDGGEGALYVLLRRERETPVGKSPTPPKRLARRRKASS